MNNKRITELYVNAVIILMLFTVAMTAFSGSYYGKVFEKEAYAPVYKGVGENKVALMFNVYGGEEYVLDIAETLSRNGYRATFFIGGVWAAKNVETVKKLHEMGFELGNHGYNHRDHSKLSYNENKKEITVTENLLREIIGEEVVKLFAPPSGAIGKTMNSVCDELGYKVIMWTRDTIDWRDKDSRLVTSRATKNMASGDLILMHPTAHTLEALPAILDYVKSKGFSAVTVSNIIA